jgi:hypothetical protein
MRTSKSEREDMGRDIAAQLRGEYDDSDHDAIIDEAIEDMKDGNAFEKLANQATTMIGMMFANSQRGPGFVITPRDRERLFAAVCEGFAAALRAPFEKAKDDDEGEAPRSRIQPHRRPRALGPRGPTSSA